MRAFVQVPTKTTSMKNESKAATMAYGYPHMYTSTGKVKTTSTIPRCVYSIMCIGYHNVGRDLSLPR